MSLQIQDMESYNPLSFADGFAANWKISPPAEEGGGGGGELVRYGAEGSPAPPLLLEEEEKEEKKDKDKKEVEIICVSHTKSAPQTL